jgi:hypothetical protein
MIGVFNFKFSKKKVKNEKEENKGCLCLKFLVSMIFILNYEIEIVLTADTNTLLY